MRKILFWLHLCSGVIAGLVIAIMAFTGCTLAFEKELVAWSESDVQRVLVPTAPAQRLPLDELLERAKSLNPGKTPSAFATFSDPALATAITYGRDFTCYANPYTGEIKRPSSTRVQDFLRLMESWHRFLGFKGEASRPVGKAVTGACNMAFLFLAVSGVYLWWPRNWSWRGFKAIAITNFRLTRKARDFNWHNSIGFWCAPVLVILTFTALPISYRWASNLIYQVTGTPLPPPNPGARPGSPESAITGPKPEPAAKRLGYDTLLRVANREIPDWTEVGFRLGARGNGTSAPARNVPAITLTVRAAKPWPRFSTTTLTLDPFTGAVLQKEVFADQNAGRRLRTWTRFLHTGEALGLPGKLAAALASFGALVLVWTGLALSWRRWLKPRET